MNSIPNHNNRQPILEGESLEKGGGFYHIILLALYSIIAHCRYFLIKKYKNRCVYYCCKQFIKLLKVQNYFFALCTLYMYKMCKYTSIQYLLIIIMHKWWI